MKIYKFLTGPLSVNTYLTVDEDSKTAFLVDPGGEDKKLLKFVEENDLNVEYIILTHGHGDHICGIHSYKEAWPEAKVVAHEAEVDFLLDAGKNMSKMTCGFAVEAEVDIPVKDGDRLKVGKLDLKFYHTPGHTKGGMCIHTGDFLFSGDTLFQGSVGRTDFPGASFEELKKSIEEKIYVLPDSTEVLPGHMGTTKVGIEKEHNPFV